MLNPEIILEALKNTTTKEQLGKTKKRYNYKEPHGIYIDQNRYCTATLCAVTKCPLHKPEKTEQNQHAEKR